eukprot:CAMPEP_0171278470 /NCGR_PEP_ID=MMETSP0790-20130122/64892_1 /TAXON_ID=2925 /ORGANISM="Alexandrium catenella, Strain OF101" /LENGTH=73 /DNA_ID=CAMNT_0011747641 /DNA_START=511 /DNA_END=728 /DNA_ORIENTATION=-
MLEVDPTDLRAASAGGTDGCIAHKDVPAVCITHQQRLAPAQDAPHARHERGLPRLQQAQGGKKRSPLRLEQLG